MAGQLQLNQAPPAISIDCDDPLALKWASLLVGYNRASDNMFHPRFKNVTLLGRLNGHPAPEVSEYSVWALWQNPAFQVHDMGISLTDLAKRPENVRRWIYRLVTKDPSFVSQNLDLIDESRQDEQSVAREGLALGLREVYVPDLPQRVILWHEGESEDFIRDLLLEHMARWAEQNGDYFEVVQQSYKGASRGGSLRQRLLAACQGNSLYRELRRVDALEEAGAAELPLQQIAIHGDVQMTSFNAGRDIQGQNLVGGNMIGSANQAVQMMNNARREEQVALKEILDFAQNSKDLSEEHRKEIAGAVEGAAKDGSPEAKRTLLGVLKGVGSGIAGVSLAASQLSAFAEIVSKWI